MSLTLEQKMAELERMRSSLRDDLGLLPDKAKEEMQEKARIVKPDAQMSFLHIRVIAALLSVVIQLGMVYFLSSQMPVFSAVFGMRTSYTFRACGFLLLAVLAALSSFVGIPLEVASVGFTWKAMDTAWVNRLEPEYQTVIFAASVAAGLVVTLRKLIPRSKPKAKRH